MFISSDPLNKQVKRILLITLTLFIIFVLNGCSGNESIKVGKPSSNNSNEFQTQTEITDQNIIEEVRQIVNNLETVSISTKMDEDADVVFTLDNEGTAEIFALLWIKDDGTGILRRGEDSYFKVNKEDINSLVDLLKL